MPHCSMEPCARRPMQSPVSMSADRLLADGKGAGPVCAPAMLSFATAKGPRVTASGATGRLPATRRAWRGGGEVLLHLAIMAAVLGAPELILRAVDLRELRDSYEPGRALLFRHDAELGWAPLPNAAASFTGTRTVSVRNNSLGLRAIEPPRPREPTVLFLGDSFVWGYDVEANER